MIDVRGLLSSWLALLKNSFCLISDNFSSVTSVITIIILFDSPSPQILEIELIEKL